MTPPSDSSPELAVGSAESAAPMESPTRPLEWLVRRELWESRSIYIAPLIVTAFVLLGSLISVVVSAANGKLPIQPFRMAPAPIMLASFIVGVFYSLDALYGERRDRSILFWKSLPVSDRTTVLSKASIPLVVLPLIAYSLSVVTQLLLLAASVPALLANGGSPAELWTRLDFFQGLVVMFYGLTVHALWFAPIYGWLMLISAWARRAPFLWAVLPLFAISAVERIVFHTWQVKSLLQYRVMGAIPRAFIVRAEPHESFDRLEQLSPLRFLSTPGLWLGLVFATACFAAAVRLRRRREPI